MSRNRYNDIRQNDRESGDAVIDIDVFASIEPVMCLGERLKQDSQRYNLHESKDLFSYDI